MHGSELTAYCLALAGVALVAASIVPMLRRTIEGMEATEWRAYCDRGLTGAALCLVAGLVALNIHLSPISTWVVCAVGVVTGVYFAVKRGQKRSAIPKLPARDPDTGVTAASPAMIALLTKGKLPFMAAPKPSLRGGQCPLCEHATVLTVPRKDTRFTCHVCASCGYTQEFADLSKL